MQLRADGFDWHCPFLVESPVLGYRQPYMGPMRQPGDSWVGGEERQWRHQRKASLTDRTQVGHSHNTHTHTHTQQDTDVQRLRTVYCARIHTSVAGGWGSVLQVWQILSPFYRVTVHDYATLLWHRVMWHEQLGMQRYILYVYESLSPLIREPLIQVRGSTGKNAVLSLAACAPIRHALRKQEQARGNQGIVNCTLHTHKWLLTVPAMNICVLCVCVSVCVCVCVCVCVDHRNSYRAAVCMSSCTQTCLNTRSGLCTLLLQTCTPCR